MNSVKEADNNKNIIATKIYTKNDIVKALVLAKSIRKKDVLSHLIAWVSFKNKSQIDILKYYYDDITHDEKTIENILLIDCDSIVTTDISNKKTPTTEIDVLGDYKQYDICKFNVLQPYPLENDISIEQRVTIPILIYWFYLYRIIINDNPEFYKNKLFKPANAVFQYFFIQLANKTPGIIDEFNDDLQRNLIKLYDMEITTNLRYYHTDISKEYDSFEINYEVPITNATVILMVGNKLKLDSNIKKNIEYKKDFNIIGAILKNILFNIQIQYTYTERKETLDKLYNDNETYFVRLIVFKTIYDVDIEQNGFDLMCYSHAYDKLRILSLLMNDKTFNKMEHLNMTAVSELNKLKYQSIKKWIYSIFNGNQVENLIIVKLNFNNIDLVTIINNNESSLVDIKRINNKKIIFIDIFYAKLQKNADYDEIIKNMYNVDEYYLFDGLKIYEIE